MENKTCTFGKPSFLFVSIYKQFIELHINFLIVSTKKKFMRNTFQEEQQQLKILSIGFSTFKPIQYLQ